MGLLKIEETPTIIKIRTVGTNHQFDEQLDGLPKIGEQKTAGENS